MQRPVMMEGVPPGLEYLTQLNQLLVKQQIEMMEGECFCLLMIAVCIICHVIVFGSFTIDV